MVDLKIRNGEHEYHFIWRVYNEFKTTGNITVEQAGAICNKELKVDYDESRHRKIYESWEKVHNCVIGEYTTLEENEIIKEIDQAKDELYKVKVRTADKLREHRTNLRNEARFDNLQDTAIKCANIMSEVYPFKNNLIVDTLNEEKLGVLLLSDFHYGITIDHFLNKYNKEICQIRVNQIISETIDTCRINNIDTLKIVGLGDYINGLLHLTTRVENEEDVITQIIEVTELLANMINDLSKYFNYIEYVDCLDNHSRVNANKKLSIEAENFGRLVSWYLKPRLIGLNNVKVVQEKLDDSLVEVDVLGELCYAVHGHQDRVGTVVQKLALLTKRIPMSIFMGHTHSHYEKDEMGVDVIVNGTLSGTDIYAKDLRLTSKPMQKLLIYKKNKDGRVTRELTKHMNF